MTARPDDEPAPPPELKARQEALAAHLRDPENAPAPEGLSQRGGQVYRRLIFNNIQGLLATNFPVLRRLLGDDAWRALVRDFLAEHRAATPYFLEVGREFLDYLAETRGERSGDPPFLLELAHYEWVELALAVADEDLDAIPADPEGDLLAGRPVLSPTAWSLQYRFPVHQIGPDFQPEEPGEQATFLVVYRDRDHAIGFLAINPVTARLLQLLAEGGDETGEALLRRIAAEIGHADPEQVVAAGADILADLARRDVVLGVTA